MQSERACCLRANASQLAAVMMLY